MIDIVNTKETMEKNFQFLLEAISTDIISWIETIAYR